MIRLCEYPILPLNFCPLVLAFIRNLACDHGALTVIFYFPHAFYICYLELFCKEKMSLYPYSFVNPMIYLCQYELMNIYYYLGYNPKLSLFNLLL